MNLGGGVLDLTPRRVLSKLSECRYDLVLLGLSAVEPLEGFSLIARRANLVSFSDSLVNR